MSESPNTAQTYALDGTDMYCETHGEGEPLLLLHGFTGIGEHWKLIFPEMPRGYRTICLTCVATGDPPILRGNSPSTSLPPMCSPYSRRSRWNVAKLSG